MKFSQKVERVHELEGCFTAPNALVENEKISIERFIRHYGFENTDAEIIATEYAKYCEAN